MSTPAIVVGVDLSRSACDATWWALGEARRRGAAVRLVHALDATDADLAADPSAAGAAAAGRAVLERHREHAQRIAPDVAITAELVPAGPVDAMIAASRDAQLVVLGSKGRAGFAQSALGSVGQRIAVHAHCPVVVVPTGSARLVNRRVVAGATDTHAGRLAVEFATSDARLWDAELVLVRDDDAVRRLVDESRTSDLLVLGCHHTDDEFNCRLGAVPSGVLAAAECPVALVGELVAQPA